MAWAEASSQFVMKAQSAAAGAWESVAGMLGFGYTDFSPEEVLQQTPNIDPHFIAKAPMSNGNLDVHTLVQLGKIGLKRGKEITAQTHPELYHAWAVMSARAGLHHVPQLILAQSNTANALTVSPQEVVVTTGLLKLLNLREVNAVLGHELGHASSDHTTPRVVSTLAFGLPGAFAGDMLSDRFLTRTAAGEGKGIITGVRNYLASGKSSLLALFVKIGAIMTGAYTGKVVANYVAFRPTELDADRKGAVISGDPEGLIMAIDKLYKSHPAGTLKGALGSLLATHPSGETRIRHLRKLAQTAPPLPDITTMDEVAPVPLSVADGAPSALITGAALAERVGSPVAPAVAGGYSS